MPNIHETLMQDEMWYGQDGLPYHIDQMEQSHRINVVNFLLRRAASLYKQHQWYEFNIMESAPEDVFNEWLRDTMNTLNDKPEEWLQRTPLMKALDKAIKAHDTIDGEVVPNEEIVIHPDTSAFEQAVSTAKTRFGSPTGRLERLPGPISSQFPIERFE